MHQPYKMQLVIEICGLPRVLFAAAVSAITRPFGIRGLFYKICGHGVAGIDGFYPDSSFEVYHTMGVINPEHPVELCDALEAATACRPSSWMRTTLTRISSARARISR